MKNALEWWTEYAHNIDPVLTGVFVFGLVGWSVALLLFLFALQFLAGWQGAEAKLKRVPKELVAWQSLASLFAAASIGRGEIRVSGVRRFGDAFAWIATNGNWEAVFSERGTMKATLLDDIRPRRELALVDHGLSSVPAEANRRHAGPRLSDEVLEMTG